MYVPSSTINRQQLKIDIYNNQGEWKDSSCGGCSNFSTFINNPMYLCKVSNSVNLTFLLSNENATLLSDAISMYVISMSKVITEVYRYVLKAPSGEVSQKLIEFKQDDLVAHGNFTSTHESINFD